MRKLQDVQTLRKKIKVVYYATKNDGPNELCQVRYMGLQVNQPDIIIETLAQSYKILRGAHVEYAILNIYRVCYRAFIFLSLLK